MQEPLVLHTKEEEMIILTFHRRQVALVTSALLMASLANMGMAHAADQNYRFELAGKPTVVAGSNIVHVRIIHIADGKLVIDAVIFESKADMGPAGMATMPAPVKAMPSKAGIYDFEVQPVMTGTWALHLAAKVQGETETVRGTVDAALVK